MNPLRRVILASVLSVVALLAAPAAVAEVAVALGPANETELSIPYIMGSIVDDPDPQGRAWQRFSPTGGSRVVLNEQGYANGDGPPSMIVEKGTRNAIVAWARNSPSGFEIVISKFSNGAWSTPIVAIDDVADVLDPFLLEGPDGTIHLFFCVADSAPRIMHVETADLSTWTQPGLVSAVGEVATRPSAVFHEGVLKVVYESHGAALGSLPKQIVLATDQGASFGYEVLAGTSYTDPNRPQIHSVVERLWVDWVDQPGQMTWRRDDASGNWDAIETESFQTSEERDYHVRGEIRGQALD
ncbi:MAG: hypothetical protein GY716_08000 [bacterium]|nr:hypothetical protein [bacterium]